MLQRKHELEKEMSIRQIVEDEKKIIEDRFKKDMAAMRSQQDQEMLKVAGEGTNIR